MLRCSWIGRWSVAYFSALGTLLIAGCGGKTEGATVSATAAGGKSSSASGAPGAGGVASGGVGGTLEDFCVGADSKMEYRGSTFPAPATGFEPLEQTEACYRTYGVVLHTASKLGIDLQLMLGVEICESPFSGPWSVDGTSARATVAAFGDDAASASNLVRGSLQTVRYPPTTCKVCLQVDDPTSVVAGARIYVPSFVSLLYATEQYPRFQLYRLADSSITPSQAAASDPNTLPLAPTPWVDLSVIASVEQSTGIVRLVPGYTERSAFMAAISDVPLAGAPFLVFADSKPIYVGSLWRSISSMMPVGPTVFVDDITDTQFEIMAPAQGIDSRFDSRIVEVLTQTGKLAP